MKHQLPKLPYAYNALEPYIDEQTMIIHHSKHHQGYVDKLNAALEKYPEFQKKSLEDLLKNINSLPKELQGPVSKNGGGHYNHSLFWGMMTSDKNQNPGNELLEIFKKDFGGFENFKEAFSAEALSVFGSGWAWLIIIDGALKIISSQNQDNPIMRGNKEPLLGLDVWEHAYYLKYQNRRAEYIQNWWNVVNWEKINESYKQLR
ncbi:superoxide dismutase [Candidatus Parcubacteria bacterium]|nr:MAG: superoxide dismutase [Candidatus Parcubacteria bacterium]